MCIRDRSSGAYKNIIVERIESMEVTLAHIIPEFTSSLLGPLIVLIYMLRIDWRIALLSLLPLPIGMIFFIHMMIVSEKGKYSETVSYTHLDVYKRQALS